MREGSVDYEKYAVEGNVGDGYVTQGETDERSIVREEEHPDVVEKQELEAYEYEDDDKPSHLKDAVKHPIVCLEGVHLVVL